VAGFGVSPLGGFPCGFSPPMTADDPPDPPENARFLDYLTSDYVVGDDGEVERMPITRQRVLLALATRLESSTVLRDFGAQLPGVIGPNDENDVRIAVETALRHLIAEGALVLNSVTVDHGNPIGRSAITVDYTDTATNERDAVNV
jgi:hypothetical protein